MNVAHRRSMWNSLFCDAVTYTDRETGAERAGEEKRDTGRGHENKCEEQDFKSSKF